MPTNLVSVGDDLVSFVAETRLCSTASRKIIRDLVDGFELRLQVQVIKEDEVYLC